jgi:hypothetical protein
MPQIHTDMPRSTRRRNGGSGYVRTREFAYRVTITIIAALTATLVVTLLATMAVGPAAAQPASLEPATGEQRVNGYLVRWNTTLTRFLSQEAIEAHDLPAEGHGVLNVVVLRDEDGDATPTQQTVEADVSASVRNLRGRVRQIDMRPVEANDAISYIGSFAVEGRDQLRFEVEIRPPGESPLAIAFERRFVSD